MAEVSSSVNIRRPVSDVFGALEDPKIQITYDGEMFRAVEQLTPDPIGHGTRFRGQFKGMGTVEYSYEQFERDRVIRHATKMPFGEARHTFEFSAEGDGTTLTQSMSVQLNILGRMMWPLMLRRVMQKRLETLNGLVKQFVERHL